MVITRELKNATWTYNDEIQQLHLKVTHEVEGMPDGLPDVVTEEVTLNRVYAFSLARFLIRVFFRMSMRKLHRPTLPGKTKEVVVESELEHE